RQVGTLILVATGAAAVLTVVALLPVLGPFAPLAGLIPLGIGFVFGSLLVEIGSGELRVAFGPGLISRTIDLAEVVAAEPVRNRIWYGFGIRYVPGRVWMWNVSGLDAVELTYRSGGRFRIGTDQPQELVAAVSEAAHLT
ncbi:MAG: hypothetical protein AAF533_23660, partial [Acidobacteriota bacterium]